VPAHPDTVLTPPLSSRGSLPRIDYMSGSAPRLKAAFCIWRSSWMCIAGASWVGVSTKIHLDQFTHRGNRKTRNHHPRSVKYYFAIKVGIEGAPPFFLIGTRFLMDGWSSPYLSRT
jgi:hypothetical protein